MNAPVIQDNTATILALIVAIIAAAGTIANAVVQVWSSRKSKSVDLYFNSMLKAYTTLLEAVVPESTSTSEEVCTRALRSVLTAVQPALLLSRPATAAFIRKFYFTYCAYMDEYVTGNRKQETIELFREQLWALQDCLRDEMYRFAPRRDRRACLRESHWKHYQKSNQAANHGN